MEELFAFVDGRSVTNNLSELTNLRRKEFDGYRKVTRPLIALTSSYTGSYVLISYTGSYVLILFL